MKRLTAAVAAALVVVGSGAARQDAAPAKSIDGTYKVVSARFGGKEDTEKAAKTEFVFKDGAVTISDDGKKDETAEFKLDPSKTPGHIDIQPMNDVAPKGERVALGIYQTKSTPDGLELTIAFTKNGGARPTNFKGEGPGEVVLRLLRRGEKK